MVIADARQPDCPIVLANRSFLALTGYSAEEVIGQNCRFLQGRGTSPAAIAQIHLAVLEGREATVEILNYRKDGSPFWNQLHISPVDDDNGDVAYFFASQIDVTEFRKVETLKASEHRLLMEVDHRAKNVLAIVDSIVRLSRADDSAQYATVVQQRVQALSVAHSLLAELGWRDVSLREVVQRQIIQYTTDDVELEGPDIPIPAVIVQPLALVFHELVSNAAIHGALSKPGGRLSLSWDKTDGHGGFRLMWREYGVRPPETALHVGFGTIVVRAVVEKQLSGRLHRDWDDAGLAIAIEVPGKS